ncbi:MAG TPA: hypothetical protein VFQ39_07900 [Longimicrobium sp.]|nr:hypothetical protein [Longimicrobium sp.]
MRRIAPAALVLFAAACSSSASVPRPNADPDPVIYSSSTTTTVRLATDNSIPVENVRATVDRVWAALPGVYHELGIPMGLSDPERFTYGNRRLSGNRLAGEPVEQLMRCGNAGSGPSAMTRFRYQFSVVTVLQGTGPATTVATEVTGTATPVEGTSSGAVLCVSNGKLEQRIAQALRGRVGG